MEEILEEYNLIKLCIFILFFVRRIQRLQKLFWKLIFMSFAT